MILLMSFLLTVLTVGAFMFFRLDEELPEGSSVGIAVICSVVFMMYYGLLLLMASV